MGFHLQKPNSQAGNNLTRFSDQLQVEHYAPLLKLRHRTSIEDAILSEEEDANHENGEAGAHHESFSSGWTLSCNSEPNCLTFDATDYLNYQQLVLLFDNRDPELMVQSVALLAKYLFMKEEQLTRHNVLRLLAASVMITFKINYDNHPDLLQFLSQVFELHGQLLIEL